MIEAQNLPIALFDSGVGGLTVLREIYRQLPQESILYFADTARLPYGDRSPETILQFVREIMDWLTKRGVKMVIMACGTGSALALEAVRAEYDLPILGLILPGAQTAVKQGKNIGVIATPATVASNAYPQAIQEIDGTTQVWQVGCPEFVPLIENNQINSLYTKQVAQKYLNPLIDKKIDTLIYGCTHYRHLDGVLRSILPASVNIVDPAESIAVAAERELRLMGLKNNQLPLPTRFCVSGSAKQFARLSRQWLGFCPGVEKICLRTSSMIEVTLESSEGI